jgi:hypothetical protein
MIPYFPFFSSQVSSFSFHPCPHFPPEVNHRLVHLDCLRGLAALLVVVEHLRAFLFVPFPQVVSPGVITKAFYLVTGLGHQAVMIFFVLSGFLVGGGRSSHRDWMRFLGCGTCYQRVYKLLLRNAFCRRIRDLLHLVPRSLSSSCISLLRILQGEPDDSRTDLRELVRYHLGRSPPLLSN